MKSRVAPGREFMARRLQSLAGFAFLLFLCEHLFTNSQATLFLGDDGKGFIDAVNWLHNLPYLQVLELTFIALPIAVHTWWGIKRLCIAKINSIPSDGHNPSLGYPRNVAFTWQRITSVLLIVAIGLHVYYMRFAKEPHTVSYGVYSEHFVKLSVDPGLYTLAPRLNLKLFDKNMINHADSSLESQHSLLQKSIFQRAVFNPDVAQKIKNDERITLEKHYIAAMKKLAPDANEVVAMCDSFGLASLMVLRDTYKSALFCILYSLFVIMACFHGCNGLWTFAITWGVSLSESSRNMVRLVSNILMGLLIFLGLACIWGVYWINLRY